MKGSARRLRVFISLFVAVALAWNLVGCAARQSAPPASQGQSVPPPEPPKPKYPDRPLEFVAPAGPGGGWDTTIRVVAKVLGEKKIITQPMPVVNKPGGGGAVALAYLQDKRGNPYEVVVYSPPLLLINLTGQTKLSYRDLTPLAMLIHDYGAFAVPKNSRYKTIKDVMEALKRDPKSVKIAGTSSAGSMDHLQFLQAAMVSGVKDLKAIQYISFQGGEGLANLMGGHVDLLTTGMAETVGPMQSGDIRVLAITAPKRIQSGPMAAVPTLRCTPSTSTRWTLSC